jgi:surface antigen
MTDRTKEEANMKQLDANTLVAYVDGELDTESSTFVETILAEDEDALQLARLLQNSAFLVRAAHNHVVHETVPERLVDTVLTAEESESGPADVTVPQHLVNMILSAPEEGETASEPAGADGRARPVPQVISLARRRSVAALASAAVFAAVMLGGGFLLGQYQSYESKQAIGGQQVNVAAAMDNPWREAAFQEALETKASHTAVIWTNPESGYAGAVIPVKTYRREDGTFCRAFRTVETNSGPQQPNYGVACREQGTEGRWVKTVEAVAGVGAVPKLSF